MDDSSTHHSRKRTFGDDVLEYSVSFLFFFFGLISSSDFDNLDGSRENGRYLNRLGTYQGKRFKIKDTNHPRFSYHLKGYADLGSASEHRNNTNCGRNSSFKETPHREGPWIY